MASPLRKFAARTSPYEKKYSEAFSTSKHNHSVRNAQLRLVVRAKFLARPDLFPARPELSSPRGEGAPSRAHISGLLRAFGSAGSARASPKARDSFFLTKLERLEWDSGLVLARKKRDRGG
jgi:hypothetical protein